MMGSIIYRLLIICALTLPGCTGMKNISSEDPLYLGAEIKLPKSKNRKALMLEAKGTLKPEPNNKFLWMRPALARYNMISVSARKKRFWKNKIAPPVLLSQSRQDKVRDAMHNRIFQSGYFNNSIRLDTVTMGSRKVRYTYTITPNMPYRFETISFPDGSNDLTQQIRESRAETLLKIGDIYNLENVRDERLRIDRNVKELGYFYFNPNFITLKADTITGDHTIKVEVSVKPETPPESRLPYSIRSVFINDDNIFDNSDRDTIVFNNYYLITRTNELKFPVIAQGMFVRPGDFYTTSNYLQTVRYLNELPIVRSATIKFTPTSENGKLDAIVSLSQRKRLAYSAEFNAVFRSTNYFGPGVIFSYTDRNLKKGAEMLKINLSTRFEIQISEGSVNPAYELGLEANYTLPGFYPGFLSDYGDKRLPKTNIGVGYNLFNRLDLYRMNSVFTNFGYQWSRTDNIRHSLNPAEIIFTKIPEASKSEEFKNYLDENPGVQRSFDEQLIVGSGYEFTYNPVDTRNDFFFRGGIDVAGNLMNGIYSAANAPKDSLGRYHLLGVPFSQYIRSRLDFRYSFNFNRSKLVTRINAGVGFPIGNSDILPYIKQFYVGGTNSLRSFIARSVGPGSEVPPDGYNDLTGDIRIEYNIEYRFNLAGPLKGALFIDAGNIWLFNKNSSRPNATFHFNTFLKEIAISSGWGLRWDFDFIVARLDFAYTMRTPYLPEGERWTQDFNIFRPTLNLAIGYPF